MTLTVGIPKEIQAGERRVAAVPQTVAKMLKAGLMVLVEAGAGSGSFITDDAYRAVGAKIVAERKTVFAEANIILKAQAPAFDAEQQQHEMAWMQANAVLITPLFAEKDRQLETLRQEKNITVFVLSRLPRIARAQSMDILSSMSNLAGYKSVILAAEHLGKIFPMLTTAAGTILPTKVIVIGAGVAGLQAIATARRLGGSVIAFDTRPAAAEQVKSLGADFVSLEVSHEASEDAGGYAKEQSAEFYQQEQAIIQQYLKEADVVITTALIPGKRAPILITEDMVMQMKQGSVIVDLAIEQQGNCTLTERDKIVVKHGVTLIGLTNLASLLPMNASQLYANNVFAFLNYLLPQLQAGSFDKTDDIIKSCLLT